MSQTITAIDLIKRSLVLINAIAAGETPDAQQSNDALLTLNEMLDSWSTETLAVYRDDAASFITTIGKAVYTIGAGGDIDVERPVYLQTAYCVRAGVSTPIQVVNQSEYDAVSIKDMEQPIVEKLLYVNDHPLGKVTLSPVPSEQVKVVYNAPRLLTNIANLQQLIILPPGYLRALRYCLAVDLWPEYNNPTTDINSIKAIAIKSKANVKVANMEDVLMAYTDIPGVGGFVDWRDS